jgi:hypothetical protein
VKRTLLIVLLVVAVTAISPVWANADPGSNNPNTLTRTLACDNGRTVDATFAGLEGVNFNVTVDQSVFIFKTITIVRPSGAVEVDDRGIQGFDPASLTTCTYTTPSGSFVTVVGFFTPRG